jgi:hypothetical protein
VIRSSGGLKDARTSILRPVGAFWVPVSSRPCEAASERCRKMTHIPLITCFDSLLLLKWAFIRGAQVWSHTVIEAYFCISATTEAGQWTVVAEFAYLRSSGQFCVTVSTFIVVYWPAVMKHSTSDLADSNGSLKTPWSHVSQLLLCNGSSYR